MYNIVFTVLVVCVGVFAVILFWLSDPRENRRWNIFACLVFILCVFAIFVAKDARVAEKYGSIIESDNLPASQEFVISENVVILRSADQRYVVEGGVVANYLRCHGNKITLSKTTLLNGYVVLVASGTPCPVQVEARK